MINAVMGYQAALQPKVRQSAIARPGHSQVLGARTPGQVIRLPLQFAGANTLRVMSYNAENFFDAVDDPNSNVKDIQWAKSAKSIKALGEVVLKENPDIIAFQEIENEAVLNDFNRNQLKGQYPNVVVYPTNDARGIRVAYMYKDSVKLVESVSHRNDTIDGAPVFSRDLLEATFETQNGNQYTFFNTHYKAMVGGEGKTAPKRERQAQRTKEIIEEKIGARPDIKIMLLGDLNTLHSKIGQKVLNILADPQDPNPSNRLVELLEKDGKIPVTHEGGQSYPDSKLDYCYATPNLVASAKARVAGKIGQNPWKTASDHLPVVIDIDDPAKTAAGNVVQFGAAFNQNVAHLQTGKRLQLMG